MARSARRLWIAIQVLIEAHLTGASWAAVAALVVSYGIELHVIDVPIHPAIITRIKDETAKFWQMIEAGEEPPPDYGKDAALIEQLFARPEEIEIDLTGDNEFPEAVQNDQTLGKSLAEISELRKARRAEILHKLGNATKARIATGTITAKSDQAQSLCRAGIEAAHDQVQGIACVKKRRRHLADDLRRQRAVLDRAGSLAMGGSAMRTDLRRGRESRRAHGRAHRHLPEVRRRRLVDRRSTWQR